MKTLSFIPLFLFLLTSCSSPVTAQSQEATPHPKDALESTLGETHRARYPIENASQKIVDNRGNGLEDLYGTRNMRSVLNGVYYRGGANNYYHRENKRNNMNPLPNDGLLNLCEEGFGRAIYLYETNFHTAPKVTECRQSLNQGRLDYESISALANGGQNARRLLEIIFNHIQHPELGPIYAHCWNGWHASGFLAAITLKQFCGFSSTQAVRYWDLNTDGNNRDSGYEKIRNNIRNFQPYEDMVISQEEKNTMCPNPDTLAFQKNEQ
ncbi:MAG: hypothetical protein M9962_08535 [Oligoflexia bacterium]|nr:hypothetical protein [Oligoflexia bacterium]